MTTTNKVFQQRCPELYRAIFGKRYLLPQYRSGDYQEQDTLNRQMFDWFVAALTGRINFNDDLMRMLLVNYAMALCYNRPTLYAERELCEALERTDLPSDLSTKDIHFKWPQLRIILPLGTISREGHSLTHLDMCLVGAGQTVNLPEPIRAELSFKIPVVENQLTGTGFNLLGTISDGPTFYSYRTAWNNQKLGQSGSGRVCDQTCDQTDRNLTDRMFRLSLNLLLFLGARPIEYDPLHFERPARLEGKHLRAALARAHFVGQEAYRPSSKKPRSSDRHCAPHFTAGHWRRCVYGRGRSQSRLRWIAVYFAGDKQEHATDESGADGKQARTPGNENDRT